MTYRRTARYQVIRRVLSRAQGRARTRLMQAHADEYHRYYDEEKALAYRDLSAEDRATLESGRPSVD